MEMKIPAIAISAFIVIVVLAGVLMPVLDDAVDDQKTIFNNENGRYSQRLDTEINDFRMVVVWNDVTNVNATVTIGDNDPYTYATSTSRSPLIVTEGGMFAANKANSRGTLYYSGSASSINVTASPITITVENGTVTLTDSADTPNVYTWSVGSWLFYPDSNGNYSAMNTTSDRDTKIYLNSIEDLYFAAVINTDSLGFVSGKGKECKFYSQPDTPTYSMSLLNSAEENGYTDVISTTIGDYAVSTEAGTNTDDSPFVPFITMVPRSIDGHTPSNDAISGLLMALPIMVIIALLVAVVALVIRAKQY